MDSNQRRSKVPAGTFRSSNHPPPVPGSEKGGATPPPPPPAATSARPPAKPPAPPPPAPATTSAAAPKKRERVGTLSGHPPGIELPTEVDGRAKFTNTLVGVTPSHAPPPPAAGPVLAPPPWRGASAYQSGQEPQPRVSSISSPGITAAGVLADGTVAHPDDRRVPHTRITAAAPPAPSPEVEEPAPATAAIGDAIQQLLDAQTSVSMEGVQESGQDVATRSTSHALSDDEELLRDSALQPVRESQIEVVRDSAIEEELPAEPVRSLPPAAPVARRAAPATEPIERSRVEPSAVPEPRATPPSARWASTPTPVAAPVESKPELSDQELAAYSFVESEPERTESVAPSERGHATAGADDSNVRLGLLVAAAILVVGIGGWAATRGGFVKPPRTPASAPAIAAPPPSAAVKPAVTEPAPSPELGDVAPEQPAAPAQAQAVPPATGTNQPGTAPAAAADPGTRPVAARPPRAPRSSGAEPPEAPAAPVLSVTPSAPEPAAAPAPAAQPSAPEGPLPETPTRENVQSALDAKRSEVLACAAGQHGVAEVDLTVSSSGAVTHAVVAGDFAGSPAGSCIARVVRTARFAPFSKPRFRVIYPFSL